MSFQIDNRTGNITVKRYTTPYSLIPGIQIIGEPMWYDHATGLFAVGEYSETEPDFSNWYWNIKEHAAHQLEISRLKSASIADPDPIGTKLAGVNPQLYGKAQEFIDISDKAARYNERDPMKFLRSGAILKREDFTAFKTIRAQTKILTIKPRRHIVSEMVDIDNVSEWDTKIWMHDGPWDMVQENLPELNVPDITGFPSFTPMTIPMERNAIHYAMSEEFISETFDVPLKQSVIDNLAGQFELVLSRKIADAINLESDTTTYGSWETKTGIYSDNNPSADINIEATKIDETQKMEGLILASTRKVFNVYQNNTNNTNMGTPNFKNPDYTWGNAIYTGIQHFPGLDWGVDSFFEDDKVFLFDPSSMYVAQMPERITKYKSPYGTHEGTIIRKNWMVRALDTTRMLGLDGIST